MMRLMFLALLLVFSKLACSQITEIIDQDGDGISDIEFPRNIVVDSHGNIYIGGKETNNVFRLSASANCNTTSPLCEWIEILDGNGAGVSGQIHADTFALAVDSQDNLYVVGRFSDNVWRINNPQNCSTSTTACDISEIINANGDGLNILNNPEDVTVDHLDNVYVAGTTSHNIFRIAASTSCNTIDDPCLITEVIDSAGDGTNGLFQPGSLAVDSLGNVFTSNYGDNVLMVETPNNCTTANGDCDVREIMDDSLVNDLHLGYGIVADSEDNIYVSSIATSIGPKVFKIDVPHLCSNCNITEIFSGNTPQQAIELKVDGADNVYVAGGNGNNVLRIDKPENCSTNTTLCQVTEIIDASGDGSEDLVGVRSLAVHGVDVYVAGAGSDNAFRISDVADLTDLIFADDFE